MASQGYHKELTSTNVRLELKRAGKDWTCAGVYTERGNRPGRLSDMWMIGRSRRCMVNIDQGSLYVANTLLPPFVLESLRWQWLPLCLHCAMDSYGEYFEGADKAKYLRPLTPELREQVKRGLVRLKHEAERLEVA